MRSGHEMYFGSSMSPLFITYWVFMKIIAASDATPLVSSRILAKWLMAHFQFVLLMELLGMLGSAEAGMSAHCDPSTSKSHDGFSERSRYVRRSKIQSGSVCLCNTAIYGVWGLGE